MIRITSKIQSFHPFTTSSFYYLQHSLKISSKFIVKSCCRLDPDDPDGDPDHSKSIITCSLYHLGHLLKMSSQSIHNFLRYVLLHFTDPEDPYSDPDHFQNSVISSFYLFRHILKISSKSVHKFFCYNVHKHIWQPGSR